MTQYQFGPRLVAGADRLPGIDQFEDPIVASGGVSEIEFEEARVQPDDPNVAEMSHGNYTKHAA